MDKNKTVAMGLILVISLIFTLLPFSILISAQPLEQQNAITQRFMETAQQARQRTYEFRELIMEKIGNVQDDVDDLLIKGDALLAEGEMQNSIEAMYKYRMAYRHMYQYLLQNGIDTDAPERARGILVAVKQAQSRIERLNNTLNAVNNTLGESDLNFEEVKTRLEWGWANLTEATHDLNLANESLYLKPSNVVWAANNLTEANNDISETHILLCPIARLMNHRRIKGYLYNLNRLRERIRERIQERLHQGGFNLSAILERLGYNNMEEFEQEIDGLMEYVRQHAEQSSEASQNMWRITQRLNDMELGIQNRWQGQH